MSETDTPRTDNSLTGHEENCEGLLDCSRQLERELNALKKGEFICKRCGLRKDDEHEPGDF